MSFKVPSWELLANPSNRIVLWVNNLYPIKVHKLDFRSVLFYIPINAKLASIFPKHYNVVSIEKRIKEGGAYIHVEIPESMSEQTAFEEINAVFRVSKKYFHFASRPARVELVRGQPLVEDMDSRIPSDLIKVVPKDASTTLDADEIYRLFRKYGKLYDINKKVEEKSHQILIFYDRLEGAIAARNCLHKFSLPSSPNSTISVEYVEVQRMGWLKEQASKNPRLAFPFIGLLATLISMLLFEPIREWFIERELRLPFIKLSFISELLHFGTSCPREEEALIRSHLCSPPRAITIFSAPTGSGKSALVNTILHGKKNVIRIDFSELDSIPDADFINYVADSVGYYPTLTWIAQISGWMDVVLSPLGLSKGTFAWSAHSQLVDILHCLEGALCEVAQNAIDDPMPEWPIIVLDGILENIQSMENKKEADLLLDVFTEFAVTVVQKRGLAHVVIISSDPSAFQTCHKLVVANGGSKIKTFTLDDVNTDKALKFVETSFIALSTPIDEGDIAFAVAKVGGRVADLENFTQKVMNGMHPKDAIAILIKRAVNQIRIDGFGFSPGNYSKTYKENTRKWTQAQLWKVITKIAAEEVVFYDDLLVNIFGGNVEALTGLLNLNILRVTDNRVLAYSPLYRSAFQEMVSNTSIRVPMEITVLREAVSMQVTNLGKIQDELVKWKAMKPFNASFWNLFSNWGQTPREKELQKQITSVTKKIDETNVKLNELCAIDLKENKKE